MPMPVYEYRCEQCQARFEEYLSTSTKPAPPCPKCGASDPTRMWSSISTEWLPSDVAWDRVNPQLGLERRSARNPLLASPPAGLDPHAALLLASQGD